MCVCVCERERERNRDRERVRITCCDPEVILYFFVCVMCVGVSKHSGGRRTDAKFIKLRNFRVSHKTTDVQLAVSSSGSDMVRANNICSAKSKTQSQDAQ